MKFAKSLVLLAFALAFASTLTAPAMAQGASVLAAPWNFRVNLYGWLPKAPATIQVNDEELIDVPEDLGTILDSLQLAAMFELEAHKGPLVFYLNNVYYQGDYSKNFTGSVSGARRTFELEENVWAIKYGAGYKFRLGEAGESPDFPDLTLIPWVGAFYFSDDWKVKVSPAGPLLDGVKKSGTLNFNTPMLGLASRINLSERWYLNLSYGYGGWDVSNVDEIFDIIGNVGYRFTMWGVPARAFAGYRYLHIDYEEQPVVLNVDVKGPFLGIGWEF